ncbi:MAG: hypothetical protein Q9169_008131 [Polycauliona sp. 2 TL-2023]
MNLSLWSGFQGEGTYVIFSSTSLLCLELQDPGDGVSLCRHTPHNSSQLWRFVKSFEGDVYKIQNVEFNEYFMVSQGRDEHVRGDEEVGERKLFPGEEYPKILWSVDQSMCALLAGKMVVFRCIKTPGYVLTEENDDEEPVGVLLKLEALEVVPGMKQKWLLQKQPE